MNPLWLQITVIALTIAETAIVILLAHKLAVAHDQRERYRLFFEATKAENRDLQAKADARGTDEEDLRRTIRRQERQIRIWRDRGDSMERLARESIERSQPPPALKAG